MINFVHCNCLHWMSASVIVITRFVKLYVKQNKNQIYHKLQLHHICFLVAATHDSCMLFANTLARTVALCLFLTDCLFICLMCCRFLASCFGKGLGHL